MVLFNSKVTFTRLPDMLCTHFRRIPDEFQMRPLSSKKGRRTHVRRLAAALS